jgi:meiotic recombination protein REC8
MPYCRHGVFTDICSFRLVKQKISDERARREEELEEVPVDFTIFQDIIKPGVDTRPTAAKHFYHLLVLATKNMLAVSQEEPYGPIQISVL